MALNIYPVTAENTEKIDDTHTLVEKQWTIGYYTLVRTRYSDGLGLGKSTWTVRAAHRDLPEIVDAAPRGSALPEFGVNWSAMGTRSVAEARRYADRLTDAARVAERFTLIAEFADED